MTETITCFDCASTLDGHFRPIWSADEAFTYCKKCKDAHGPAPWKCYTMQEWLAALAAAPEPDEEKSEARPVCALTYEQLVEKYEPKQARLDENRLKGQIRRGRRKATEPETPLKPPEERNIPMIPDQHAHPWTPERRAKFMATAARKKAERENGKQTPAPPKRRGRPPKKRPANPESKPAAITPRYAAIIQDLELQFDRINRAIKTLKEIV